MKPSMKRSRARCAAKAASTFLLAVGGGSVIDGAKFVAAAVPTMKAMTRGTSSETGGAQRDQGALPFGTVLTLPATGSEMNNGSVVIAESDPGCEIAVP